MSNFSELYDLLAKLKSKLFTQSQYQLVKQAARKEGRVAVNLWRFKPEIRILFKMAKYQSYLMLFLGVTVLPFTLYQKYQQDKQKLTRIIIFTPFALGACIGPVLMYKKFSKKLIESISFNFQTKKILLTRFKDGKQTQTDLNQITTTKSDKGRVKQLIWNKPITVNSELKSQTRTYQIQGLGQWESVQLFNFLVQNSNKESI